MAWSSTIGYRASRPHQFDGRHRSSRHGHRLLRDERYKFDQCAGENECLDRDFELTEPQRRMLAEVEEMTVPSAKRRRSHGPNEAESQEPEEIDFESLATEDEASGDETAVRAAGPKRARTIHSPHVKRPVEVTSQSQEPPNPQHPELRAVDVLLLETRRLRPYLGGYQYMTLWDQVASAVRAHASEFIVHSGRDYINLLIALKGVVEGDPLPAVYEHVTSLRNITDEQRKLLAQIDWPRQRSPPQAMSVQTTSCQSTIPTPLTTKAGKSRHPPVPATCGYPSKMYDESEPQTQLYRRIAQLERQVQELQTHVMDQYAMTAMWTQRFEQERQYYQAQIDEYTSVGTTSATGRNESDVGYHCRRTTGTTSMSTTSRTEIRHKDTSIFGSVPSSSKH